MSWIELMKYSPEDDEFYISREGTGNSKLKEKYPLSHWQLLKQVTVYVHVERKITTEDLDVPEKVLHYSVPLTYSIIDDTLGKTVYLKLEKQIFENSDDIRSNWVSLYFRDVDSGQTQQVPLPNSMFSQDAFPFLKIQRGESRQLTKKQAIELYKSGLCIGKYDARMENRL